MRYDLIVYDLDGTLIDSEEDLVQAVNASLVSVGREPIPHDVIRTYVGNGAPMLIRRALGGNPVDEELQQTLEHFLWYYRFHCLDFTKLYPGVTETLEHFAQAGARQAVLTNKPERPSNRIIAGLGVAPYFFRIWGGDSFEEKKPHPMGLEALMREAGVAAERTLMVGDSSVDIRTARNAGVAAAGLTYGFQPEGLRDDPPDFLLDEFTGLISIVAG